MSKPMIQIHDTGTDKVIEREMTDAEHAQYLKDLEQSQNEKTYLEQKRNARQSALNKLIDLGLTEEEIAAL